MATGPSSVQVKEQRKVISALFADVVGSTTLGEELDPEDLMEIVGGAVSRMVEPIERFGGIIKDLAGDGLLALFGVPDVHEDDAERAVRAALEIATTINHGVEDAQSRRHPPIQVRVGIETGMVAVGLVGGGARVEVGAMGDAVNTAARLQSAAQPGTVVVGLNTYERVRDRFEWDGPLHLSLKGKAEPVEAYQAVRSVPVGTVGYPDAGGIAVTVGRNQEVEEVAAAARRLVDTGTGAIIFVTGEPGVGKSKMLSELRQAVRTRDFEANAQAAAGRVTYIEGAARSFSQNAAYALVQDVLRGWLLSEAGTFQPDVHRFLDEVADGNEHLAVLGPLLGVPGPDTTRDAVGAAAPEEIETAIRAAVAALFSNAAQRGPLLIVLEDLHWADPSSIRVLEHVVPSANSLPILFGLSARNEHGPWESLRAAATAAAPGHFTELPLGPLAGPELSALLAALLDDGTVQSATRQRIAETTGGNPFFVSELVASLRRTGAIAKKPDGSWQLDLPAGVDVPQRVEHVLMSRIDALARKPHDTLLAAAVIGSPFSADLLQLVTGDSDLSDVLRDLESADFVRREPGRPGTYRFRHALIQETAYGSLLKRRRRELHAATASAMRTLLGEDDAGTSHVLARHLMEAGDLGAAYHYGRVAGDRSRATFANAEAISSYELALEAAFALRAADTVVESPPAVASVAESLGQVHALVGNNDDAVRWFEVAAAETTPANAVDLARLARRIGDIRQVQYRNEDALAQYKRAIAILNTVGPSQRTQPWWETRVDIRLEQMAVYYWAGDVDEMAALDQEVQAAVRERGTTEQHLRHTLLAKDLRLRQRRYRIDDEILDLARAHLSAASSLADERHIARASLELGFCELFHGDFDAAEVHLGESISGATRIGDAAGRVRSLAYLTVLSRLRGDEQQTTAWCDELLEASGDAGVEIYLPLERAHRAWLAWKSGNTQLASSLAQAAVADWATREIAFPFQWTARWVLFAITAGDHDLAAAAPHSEALSAPEQQPPPAEIEAQLAAFRSALRAGNRIEALRIALDVIALASVHGYL